jgi:predicted phage terminase large subunit-like protein
LYIIDWLRGKWESPELLRHAQAFWHKHKDADTSRVRGFYVEDKASGTGLIQTLKRGADTIPVIPVGRTTDKLTRLQDELPYIESGRVFLPEGASWVSDFLAECEQFQADMKHPHDDQVDVLTDLIHLSIGQNDRGIQWSKLF